VIHGFSDKNRKRRGIENLLESCKKLVRLIVLWEAAEHTVWCSLEQSLIDDAVDQWPTRLRVCV